MSNTVLDPRMGLPVVHLVGDEDVLRDALAWLLRSRLLSEGYAVVCAFESWLRQRPAELTERITEVMRLVITGRPRKLSADDLCISVRTVEGHRARICEKMNPESAMELGKLSGQAGARAQEGPDGR